MDDIRVATGHPARSELIPLTHVRRPALRLLLVALGLSRGGSDHTPEEQACLQRWAEGRRQVAELGVAEGRGTAILSRSIRPDGVVFAVDPFPPGRLHFSIPRAIARLGVRRGGGARVSWLRMTADEAHARLSEAGETLDLVFSDACFAYAELNVLWAQWRELIVPGGIFVQSTSRVAPPRTDSTHDTVRWTADVLVRDPGFEVVDVVGTFTVLRRGGDADR